MSSGQGQPGGFHRDGPSPPKLSPIACQPLSTGAEQRHDRDHRAASVLSGMSQEDMEAAETLKSLQAQCRPAPEQAPPTLIESRTTFSPDHQPEPLFSLLTSQFPLTASMINRSLSVYRGTQSLIPGAYTVEQNLGLPLASMLGRVTGVEGGIRWALQPRRRSSSFEAVPVGSKVDLEAAILPDGREGVLTRRSSMMSEQLPPYDDAGRSPPYQEHQLVARGGYGQTPPGWRAQLMISTSGLGVAMSEESLRSLRYCLSWLRWANSRLGGVIVSLTGLLKESEVDGEHEGKSAEAGATERACPAALAGRVQQLKDVVLQTLKQVVGVVSNYAGGALPENARNLVHRHITSLPLRFRLASSKSSDRVGGNESVGKVLMLAQEGLSMMLQVSGVVNDTLVSAESWCEKLGRHADHQPRQGQSAGDDDAMVDEDEAVEAEAADPPHTERVNSIGQDVQMDD